MIVKIQIPFQGIHPASITPAWFFIQKFYLIIQVNHEWAALPLQPIWTVLPKYICRNNESSRRNFTLKTLGDKKKNNHGRNHCSLNMPKQSSSRIHTLWSRKFISLADLIPPVLCPGTAAFISWADATYCHYHPLQLCHQVTFHNSLSSIFSFLEHYEQHT